MELETRRFPAGKDHGIGNHGAFLQERIVAVKFIEFRPMQHVWFQTRFRERFRDGNSCKIANIFRRNPSPLHPRGCGQLSTAMAGTIR